MNNFLGIKFKALKLAQTSSAPLYFADDIDMTFSFSARMCSPDAIHWTAEIPLVSDFTIAANVGTVLPFSAEITGNIAAMEGVGNLIPSAYIGPSEFVSQLIVQARMSADEYGTIQSVITGINGFTMHPVVCAAKNIKSVITITASFENLIKVDDALYLNVNIPLASDFTVAANADAKIPLAVEILGDFAFIGCASKLVLSLPIQSTEWASALTIKSKMSIGNYKLMKSMIAIADAVTIKSVLYNASNVKAPITANNSVEVDIDTLTPFNCSILSESNLSISLAVGFASSISFKAESTTLTTATADAVIESACNIEIASMSSTVTITPNVRLLKHIQLSDFVGKTLVELAQFNLENMRTAQI